MKRNKILVIGGTGFIGSNLCRKLCRLNYEVDVIGTGKYFTIADLKGKIKYHRFDLRKKGLDKLLKKIFPDIIIHLAAYLELSRDKKHISKMLDNNFMGTLNLYMASMGLRKLKGVINFGSAEEYGQNKAPFNENQKEHPVSPYSLSKVLTTYLSLYFYKNHNLPIMTLRPFLVYGEYQTNNQLVPLVIRKCLRNETIKLTPGNQTRDFLYIRDLVDAIIKAMKKPIPGEIVNICSGKEIKVKDAVLLIKKLTKSKSEIKFGAMPYRKGENMHFYGSNSKAMRLYKWKAKYSFRKGLENTIDYFK